jgi:hypothetical protein
MKRAHRQASRNRGPATHAAVACARTRGGEDPDGGLHLHSSSGKGGPGQGYRGQDP